MLGRTRMIPQGSEHYWGFSQHKRELNKRGASKSLSKTCFLLVNLILGWTIHAKFRHVPADVRRTVLSDPIRAGRDGWVLGVFVISMVDMWLRRQSEASDVLHSCSQSLSEISEGSEMKWTAIFRWYFRLNTGHFQFWACFYGAAIYVFRACRTLMSGWWFGTFFPIYWECHHPNWLSYFSEGFKPPTRCVL